MKTQPTDGGIKRHRREPFTIVRNAILEDDSLSWKAKGILAYLLGKPDGWVLRVRDLANKGTDGKSAIWSALGELRAAGYVHLEQRKEAGRFAGSIWHVSETPEFLDGPPCAENQHAENPETENRDVSKTDSNKTDLRCGSEAERIYEVFPKKVAKPIAIREIKVALKRVPFIDLLAATEHLAERWKGADVSYCQRASVWFKEERYNDPAETWGPRENARPKAKPAPAPYTGPAIESFGPTPVNGDSSESRA